mgnify:FL=1
MANSDVHDEVKSFLGDIDEDINVTTNTESAEDDEFEKLLQEFISNELTDDDRETIANDEKEAEERKPRPSSADTAAEQSEEDPDAEKLYDEEKALYNAHRNFVNSIIEMAQQNNLAVPDFSINANMLYPRYKPTLGEKFALDTLKGWDIMIQAHPTRIMNIKPNAKDEELLEFAEKTTDDTLQMAVISYVEILIEIESCEIAYEKRRLKAKRRKIEREVVEEHQRRLDKMKKYIAAIEEKEFPINAERLVTNYFKTSRKDADGAYKMLTNNPATFAPIEVSKIKARFFGMIKAKPEDGIRINKELGAFLKKLKA